MSPDTKVDSIHIAFRQSILDGDYGKAGRIPSLRLLSSQFNTSHETMNKVVQRLQAEGLLMSLGRAGVFVNFPRKHIPGITPRFDAYLEQQGLTPEETNIEEPSIVPATEEVASVFDIEEGSSVVQRYRRQGTSTEHYRLAKNLYPVELAGGEILEKMQQNVHFDVLAAIQDVHQKAIKRVHEDVFGRLPTLQEQGLLQIVRNTPVFEILRTSYASDDDETVIMYSRIIAVASYFVLSYDYKTSHWAEE